MSTENEWPDEGEDLWAELSPQAIEYWKNKGRSQSWIAKRYGVSRQAISWYKHYYGLHQTPREIVLQHFPWQVSAEQQQTSPFRNMRNHGEYMATGGVGMSEDKLKRLRSFYAHLKDTNQVLEFDPTIPPIEGVSNKGGFAYRRRRSSDGDLLIRVNEYSDLTEEGRRIWRFPPIDP